MGLFFRRYIAPGLTWYREICKEVVGRKRCRGGVGQIGPTHHGRVADDRSADHGGRTWSIFQHDGGHGWYVNLLEMVHYSVLNIPLRRWKDVNKQYPRGTWYVWPTRTIGCL